MIGMRAAPLGQHRDHANDQRLCAIDLVTLHDRRPD
jgi:hypothetical protein